MAIILPVGHEHLVVERLPFATIAMIVISIIVYFPTSSRMEEDLARQNALTLDLMRTHQEYEFLELPAEIVAGLSEHDRKYYETTREWVQWFLDAPDEVDEWLEERRQGGQGVKKASRSQLSGLFDLVQQLPGGSMRAKTVDKIKGEMNIAVGTEDQKEVILDDLVAIGPIGLEEAQEEFDGRWDELERVKKNSLVNKVAFFPGKPTFLGAIAHQFLHADIFHLLFNMLFLWVVAVKLEERWSRGVFVAVYLVSGLAGALAHMAAHPGSMIPMIGASGAVAGLMGAFMIRLAKDEIVFFYLYFMIRLMPKFGFFKAPAYIMMGLWFLLQVFNAIFFSFLPVAHLAHIGGFLTGVAIAVAFRFTDFEQRVLGREPEVEVRPEQQPLVAFQAPPEPRPIPGDPTVSQPPPTLTPLDDGAEIAPPEDLPGATSEEDSPGIVEGLAAAVAAGASLAAGAAFSDETTAPDEASSEPKVSLLPAPDEDGDQPAMTSARRMRLNVHELSLPRITPSGIEGITTGGAAINISYADVAYIAPAMVNDVDVATAAEIFTSGALPYSPALLLAVFKPVSAGPHADSLPGFIVDCGRLDYATVMREVYTDPTKNFAALTKFLLQLFPDATYVPGAGPTAEYNVPIYVNIRELLATVGRIAAANR